MSSRTSSRPRTPAEPRRRVLVVGLDGREHDADALTLARSLQAAFGGGIVLAHVIPPAPPGVRMAEMEAVKRREGRELLERAAHDVAQRADTVLVEPCPAADGLSRVADARDASLLVLGSSHRGTLGRIVPGGVASHLLTHAPCAIAVAPVGYVRNGAESISGIGVAYDAMNESDAALAAAVTAAVELGVPLNLYHAMHAISPDPAWDEFRSHMRDFAQRLLDRGLSQLPPGLGAPTRVLEGDTATVVAEAADRDGVGLLFAGSRGYGPLREALVGGVAGALLQTARCPLIIIPRRSRPFALAEQAADGKTRIPAAGARA